MSVKQQIDQDLKAAMLAGDKTLVTTLRGLKSSIQYVEVAQGARDTGLPEPAVIETLKKEAKKRQESADLYQQGGDPSRQAAELAEKKVIEKYLPAQLPEAEVAKMVNEVIAKMGSGLSMKDMGQVIAGVRAKAGDAADSSLIARLAKEKLA